MAQVHKNNAPKVISVDGFMQFMMTIAISSATGEMKKLTTTECFDQWLNTVLYPAVANKLPINKALLHKCQGLPTGMDDEALPAEKQRLMFDFEGNPVACIKHELEVVLDEEIVARLDGRVKIASN